MEPYRESPNVNDDREAADAVPLSGEAMDVSEFIGPELEPMDVGEVTENVPLVELLHSNYGQVPCVIDSLDPPPTDERQRAVEQLDREPTRESCGENLDGQPGDEVLIRSHLHDEEKSADSVPCPGDAMVGSLFIGPELGPLSSDTVTGKLSVRSQINTENPSNKHPFDAVEDDRYVIGADEADEHTRGDGMMNGDVCGDGETKDGNVRVDGEAEDRSVRGDGEVEDSNVRGDGEVEGGNVRGDGEVEDCNVRGDGEVEGGNVRGDGEVEDCNMCVDGEDGNLRGDEETGGRPVLIKSKPVGELGESTTDDGEAVGCSNRASRVGNLAARSDLFKISTRLSSPIVSGRCPMITHVPGGISLNGNVIIVSKQYLHSLAERTNARTGKRFLAMLSKHLSCDCMRATLDPRTQAFLRGFIQQLYYGLRNGRLHVCGLRRKYCQFSCVWKKVDARSTDDVSHATYPWRYGSWSAGHVFGCRARPGDVSACGGGAMTGDSVRREQRASAKTELEPSSADKVTESVPVRSQTNTENDSGRHLPGNGGMEAGRSDEEAKGDVRDDRKTKEGNTRVDGETKEGSVCGDRETKKGDLRESEDGDVRGGGGTEEDMCGDGEAIDRDVIGDGETKDGNVRGDGETKDRDARGDGETKVGDVPGEGGGNDGGDRVVGETKDGDVCGSGETKVDMRGDEETKEGAMCGDRGMKNGDVRGDGETEDRLRVTRGLVDELMNDKENTAGYSDRGDRVNQLATRSNDASAATHIQSPIMSCRLACCNKIPGGIRLTGDTITVSKHYLYLLAEQTNSSAGKRFLEMFCAHISCGCVRASLDTRTQNYLLGVLRQLFFGLRNRHLDVDSLQRKYCQFSCVWEKVDATPVRGLRSEAMHAGCHAGRAFGCRAGMGGRPANGEGGVTGDSVYQEQRATRRSQRESKPRQLWSSPLPSRRRRKWPPYRTSTAPYTRIRPMRPDPGQLQPRGSGLHGAHSDKVLVMPALTIGHPAETAVDASAASETSVITIGRAVETVTHASTVSKAPMSNTDNDPGTDANRITAVTSDTQFGPIRPDPDELEGRQSDLHEAQSGIYRIMPVLPAGRPVDTVIGASIAAKVPLNTTHCNDRGADANSSTPMMPGLCPQIKTEPPDDLTVEDPTTADESFYRFIKQEPPPEPPESEPFACSFCDFRTARCTAEMTLHMKCRHPEVVRSGQYQIPDNEPGDADLISSLHCDVCNCTFTSESLFIVHSWSHLSQNRAAEERRKKQVAQEEAKRKKIERKAKEEKEAKNIKEMLDNMRRLRSRRKKFLMSSRNPKNVGPTHSAGSS